MFMRVNEGSKKTPKSKHIVPVASGSKNQEELVTYDSAQHANATKKNTVWGMKIFQDWNLEATGKLMDMNTVSVETLSEALIQFYCEAKPKERSQFSPSQTESNYHRNTLLNIRGAINRYLQSVGRGIDIVRDKEFKEANKALDDVMRERMKTVVSKPIAYKDAMNPADLKRISTYLKRAPNSPIVLRHCVWFNISLHFMVCGQDFHQHLKCDSFEFNRDECGEYITLSQEMQETIYLEGVRGSRPAPSDKRMYATGTETCPVKLLKLLLNKTDKSAVHLYNKYNRDALENPEYCLKWYSSKRIAKRTLAHFMTDICKNARVENRYTPPSLKATAIQLLINKGHEAGYIMSMTGLKQNRSLLKFYDKMYSNAQKKSLSSTLSTITD